MAYFFFFALAFFVFFAFFAFLAIVSMSSSFAGRPLWRGRAAPPCKSPDSAWFVCEGADDFLVDKRLDKATAPHLLWVDAVDKVGDEVANALICVFVDGLVAAPVGGATRSFSRLMANTTNAVR